MLKSEHSLENWLIPGLEQGKYKKSINHLEVLGNKVVFKNMQTSFIRRWHRKLKSTQQPKLKNSLSTKTKINIEL